MFLKTFDAPVLICNAVIGKMFKEAFSYSVVSNFVKDASFYV